MNQIIIIKILIEKKKCFRNSKRFFYLLMLYITNLIHKTRFITKTCLHFKLLLIFQLSDISNLNPKERWSKI